MLLSKEAYQKIDRELAKYPADRRQSAVMSSLRIAQEEQGWCSPEVIQDVADYLGLPPILVQEVATFYSLYNKKPVGKYKITVCTNLPCALRNGQDTGEYLKERLGIEYGETTADGLITVEEGECMGACGDAPVALVNNRHMCVRMERARIDELINDIYQEEGMTPVSPVASAAAAASSEEINALEVKRT